ncbi:MAG TPA: hypothetical protein VFW33_14350 [Gemmataceae bacterium]|nr:hypothetical protein [Gemmataceae bacterium]
MEIEEAIIANELEDCDEAAELEARAAAIRAKVATGGPVEEPDLTPEEWEEFYGRPPDVRPPDPAAGARETGDADSRGSPS